MLQAILFDLGDTLLDFEPMDTRALFRQGARLSYEFLASLGHKLPPFNRYTSAHNRAMRWAYLWAKLTRREFNWMDLIARTNRRLGLPDDLPTLRHLIWLWYAPLCDYTRVEDDLASTLAALREAGIKLGVVSNTFVPGFVHDRHLEMTGLLDFFDVRLYSSEIGIRKPDRRIFLEAAQQMDVAPSQTLFVGDLVKTDVVGAQRAGMKTALKQPWSNPRKHRLANHLIRKISDLLTILVLPTPAEPLAMQ